MKLNNIFKTKNLLFITAMFANIYNVFGTYYTPTTQIQTYVDYSKPYVTNHKAYSDIYKFIPSDENSSKFLDAVIENLHLTTVIEGLKDNFFDYIPTINRIKFDNEGKAIAKEHQNTNWNNIPAPTVSIAKVDAKGVILRYYYKNCDNTVEYNTFYTAKAENLSYFAQKNLLFLLINHNVPGATEFSLQTNTLLRSAVDTAIYNGLQHSRSNFYLENIHIQTVLYPICQIISQPVSDIPLPFNTSSETTSEPETTAEQETVETKIIEKKSGFWGQYKHSIEQTITTYPDGTQKIDEKNIKTTTEARKSEPYGSSRFDLQVIVNAYGWNAGWIKAILSEADRFPIQFIRRKEYVDVGNAFPKTKFSKRGFRDKTDYYTDWKGSINLIIDGTTEEKEYIQRFAESIRYTPQISDFKDAKGVRYIFCSLQQMWDYDELDNK